MDKPISFWTNTFAKLGLKLRKKPGTMRQLKHRTMRMEQLQDRRMLATDLVASSFAANGQDWQVTYNVTDQAATAFDVGIYRSSDGQTADTLIQTARVSNSGDLSVGSHTITIDPNFTDAEQDYYLLVKLDNANENSESNETNNQAAFGGGIFLNGSQLHVHGTDGADSLDLDRTSTLDVTMGAFSYSYNTSAVTAIRARMHDGNDTITTATSISVSMWAFGGDGDDAIHGTSNDDKLYGGEGNDTIYGGDDDDDGYGGNGGADVIYGGAGNDYLVGQTQNDVIYGDDGNDTIYGDHDDGYGGLEGADVLHGGLGADTLFGGPQNDTLYGDAGNDTLDGEAGIDTLFGGEGLDTPEILDNGETGYVETGSWDDDAYGGGFGGDQRIDDAGSGSEKATWTFSNLPAADYAVHVTWDDPDDYGGASDAPFSVYDGATLEGVFDVNQQVVPSGSTVADATWNQIGADFTITSGTIIVELTDDAAGDVRADAVRIVRLADRFEPKPCTSCLEAVSPDAILVGENFATGNVAVQNSGSLLTYYSQFASGWDTVMAFSTLEPTNCSATLESVEATLTTFGTATPDTTIWFDGSQTEADTSYAFAFPVDVSGLATGSYDWTVQLTAHYSDESFLIRTITGEQKVINTLGSAMAAGWFPFGVSYLIADGSDILLMRSGMQRFNAGTGGEWTHETDYDTNDYTLAGDWGSGFTLTAKDGTIDQFGTGGQITSTTDRNGNVTSYAYSSGKLSSITYPSGREVTFSYDQQTGYLSSTTRPDGVSSTYTLDGNNRIATISMPDPDGDDPLPVPVVSLAYDETTGLLSTVTFGDGGVQSYEYDHARRLQRIERPDGTEDTYVSLYAAAMVDTSTGTGASEQNPAQLIAREDLQVTSTVAGVTKTSRVDKWGLPVEAVDGEGNITIYERNASGQIVRTTDPDPDDEGLQASSVTQYLFDNQNNLVAVTQPDGSDTHWEYDEAWNVVSKYIDEAGVVTVYSIDANNGNVLEERIIVGLDDTQSQESDDLVTAYSYTDSGDGTIQGLLESSTDPSGSVTEYEYNSRGDITRITYASGTALEATVEYEYDDVSGMLLARIDELGRRTEYLYDALNRNTHIILPAADMTGSAIDDSDATGFSTAGTWNPEGSYIYTASGDGSRTATWEFTGLDSDKYYEVFITWTADSANADDAPFTLYDGAISGETLLQTIDIDQSGSPAGSKLIGDSWQRLGVYELNTATLIVTLTNDAQVSKRIVADSVLILEHSVTRSNYGPDGRLVEEIDEAGRASKYGYGALGRQTHTYTEPADTTGALIDDGDGGFATSDPWTIDLTRGEQGDLRYVQAGDGTVTATWMFDELDPHKRYIVLTTWDADSNNATNAPYGVYDGTTGDTLLDTIVVDQQVRPSIRGLFGADWQTLGTYRASGDTLTIELTDDANGNVIADCVRIIEAGAMFEQFYDTNGNVIGTIDEHGSVTEYTYDNDGRLTSTIGPYSDVAGALSLDAGDSWTESYRTDTYSDVDCIGGDFEEIWDASGYVSYYFEGIAPNTPHEIWVTYPVDQSNVTDAIYELYDGWYASAHLIDSYTVNQTALPSGSRVFGDQWHYLATITPTTDVLYVYVRGGVGVVADAVTVVEARPVTEAIYDGAGRLWKEIDPYGSITEYIYDSSDRVIQTISADPDGTGALESSVSYTYYDSSQFLTGTIDPVGNVRTFLYDDLSRYESTYAGQVIAPSDDAYTETNGSWLDGTGGLYGQHRKATTVDGTPTATASWTFENLMLEEEYDIYISWMADESGSEDVHFSVYKGGTSGTFVDDAYVDQTAEPSQDSNFLAFSDAKFQKIGTVTLSNGDPTIIVVTVDNATEGTPGTLALADAVYLVRTTPMSEAQYYDDGQLASTSDALGNETYYGYDLRGRQVSTTQPDPDGAGNLESPYLWRHYDAANQTVATVCPVLFVNTFAYDGRGREIATYGGQIVDDSTTDSFTAVGQWSQASDGGLLGGYRTVASVSGAATATATWTFENLIVGDDYDVYITWKSVTSGANDVPVAIYQGSTGTTAIYSGTIDQSSDPTADSDLIAFSGRAFTRLGNTITLTDSTLIIQLTNDSGENEVISADAVYVVRKDPMSQSVYDNDGMLVTSIDADGNEITYTYDALGRGIAITQADPDGAGTDYSSPVTRTYYNSSGQASATLGPDGRTDMFGYDDAGRQTAVHTGQTIAPTMGNYDEPSGTWTSVAGGFLGSYQTVSSVTGTANAAATWTFSDLVPGEEYEVYVYWTAGAGNATDAHFSVYLDSTAGTLIEEVDFDQTNSPAQAAGFPELGTARFELLTTYEFHESDSTTLVVQLSNDSATSGSAVIADAVYVVRKEAMSESIYDFAGRLVATVDAAGNRTDFTYDLLGRRTEVLLPDPDGDGPLSRPGMRYVYDAADQIIDTIEYEGESLSNDARGSEFQRIVDISVDIGAYEGADGPEVGDYVVDTLVDQSNGNYEPGDLSLREAIYLAGLNPGCDTITFATQLSGTLNLTLGHLTIDSDVTIRGPGSDTITIDAGGTAQVNRRAFYISADVTATISGLSLTGGYHTYGGAIYAYLDTDVTLTDLTIFGNHATGGGGVYAIYSDSLSISSCIISGNSADSYGGGIEAVTDRVNILDTTVSDNSTRYRGAGIYADKNEFRMVNCVVSGNFFNYDTPMRYGAGINLSGGGTARISDTLFENNEANGVGEYSAVSGGGIYSSGGPGEVSISNCTIRNNSATSSGGGVYFSGLTLDITCTAIEENEANQGGGVYGTSPAPITISDSLIADNTAHDGGGVRLLTESVLSGVTVSGNTATTYGGGLYLNDTTHLIGCTVTNNAGGYGGGIYGGFAYDNRLDNTIVAANSCTSSSPDICTYRGFDPNSSNNLIGNNSSLISIGITDGARGNQVGTYGSPIDPLLDSLAHNGGPTRTHMPQAGSPVLDAGSTLLATTYYDGRGESYIRTIGVGTDIGAVEYNSFTLLVDELTDGSGMTLQEAIAAANANPGHDTITFSSGLDFSADVDITLSAGIDITGDLTIIGPGADVLTISGNSTYRIVDLAEGTNVRFVGLTFEAGSATGAGGAIRSLADELTLEECQILDSSASTDGGAIYATGRLNLFESTLAGNSATDGGAVMLYGGDAFIRQSTFAENTATNGGAIALESSATATILQSTIVENEASGNGGGLKITFGNVLLHNTLIADNLATTAYPDVAGTVLAASSYNLISDGTGMSGISDGLQGNQIGTSGTPIDAKLGQFDDHGGPVKTVALRVDSPALDAGSTDLALLRVGRSSSAEYDMLGRLAQDIAIDPDGIDSQNAPVTTYGYDANGNVVSKTDPLGNVIAYVYDNLGRNTSEIDAEARDTVYTYDAAGRVLSLTDPEENTTTWTYDPLGRVATETINVSSTDLTRALSYDARGNLVRTVDRNGRVIDYAFDALSRQTTETWYGDLTDADSQQNAQKTYTITYDRVGHIAAIGDGDYDFEYTYSIFGNQTTATQDLAGLTDDVIFNYTYDTLGRMTSVTAAFGSTSDYVTTFAYNNVDQITQIRQKGIVGGNAVAEKRVDYAYNDDLTRVNVVRFADLAGTIPVAETEKSYDELGRVTDIVHARAEVEFSDYDLAWSLNDRLADFDFDSLVGDNGAADFAYDDANQLTSVNYDYQSDETYVYDSNGNRTNGGSSTGEHNRLATDGIYDYTYDNEGNVLAKTDSSTNESVEYTWDHRNRLTKVTFKDSEGTPTKVVEYAYDFGQRWVRQTVDSNADEAVDESRVFVHDDGQIVLDFTKTGSGSAGNSDLVHRYLWGARVDDLLADETVVDASADDVAWPLTDHQNSVRDLVVYDPGSETVSVVEHMTYDAFGNLTSGSATGLFRYTGRAFDLHSQLQNNGYRWYNSSIGRWASLDPVGFAAADTNLYRYVSNDPLNGIDPSGLVKKACVAIVPKIKDTTPEIKHIFSGKEVKDGPGRWRWFYAYGEYEVTAKGATATLRAKGWATHEEVTMILRPQFVMGPNGQKVWKDVWLQKGRTYQSVQAESVGKATCTWSEEADACLISATSGGKPTDSRKTGFVGSRKFLSAAAFVQLTEVSADQTSATFVLGWKAGWGVSLQINGNIGYKASTGITGGISATIIDQEIHRTTGNDTAVTVTCKPVDAKHITYPL